MHERNFHQPRQRGTNGSKTNKQHTLSRATGGTKRSKGEPKGGKPKEKHSREPNEQRSNTGATKQAKEPHRGEPKEQRRAKGGEPTETHRG